jgi:hypothetical protein
MSRIGSKLENLFLRRICSSFSKAFSCRDGLSGAGGGRAGSQAPTCARGPAAEEKSQPQRVTKYNEFYGGVRCYTYISRRAELAHL